jgi:alkanesulfonate monooxygenase SsuD/methylene tetrahydromethanopterin reductase-like flavin-dependent oxidoreductase (luciferase family)
MTIHKPFRFGAIGDADSRERWVGLARKVEGLGYAMLLLGDHPAMGGLGPLTALMVAADATTRLRHRCTQPDCGAVSRQVIPTL